MVKETFIGKIMATAIALIIAGVFLVPLTDIFTPPEIVPVAKHNGKVCPTTLNFGPGEAFFSINLQNIGDDGSLFVVTNSGDVLSKTNYDEEFKSRSKKTWIVNKKEYQAFNFYLKPKEDIKELNDFTISFNYGCYEEVWGYKFYCKESTYCCNYQRKAYLTSEYKLLSQLCS